MIRKTLTVAALAAVAALAVPGVALATDPTPTCMPGYGVTCATPGPTVEPTPTPTPSPTPGPTAGPTPSAGPEPSATPAPTEEPQLPVTGSGLWVLVALGAAVAIVGGGMRLAGRPRRA